MESYTYNFEISTMLVQFLDAFNEIVIKRFDRSTSHKNPTQRGDDIKPTVRYSPKQRVIDDFINNQAQMRLPVIAFSITGISRDRNRVFNKLTGPQFNAASNNPRPTLRQPVPVDLKISMSIMSRYQEDIDQIITNFTPYCDEYVVTSWPSPYLLNQEIRSVIIWDENVSLEYPTDLTYNQHFRVIGNTSFTIKGWVFKTENLDQTKLIHNIYTHWDALSGFYCRGFNLQSPTPAKETIVIEGRPRVFSISPNIILPCRETTVTVIGDSFDFTSNYYLTGSNLTDTTFYSTSATPLSSVIDGVSGIQLFPSSISQNVAQFTLPKIDNPGFIDIVALNRAGISSLNIEFSGANTGIEVINNFTYCNE